MLDLERPGDERAVAQQSAGQGLVELEVLDRAQPHGRRASPQRAVDEKSFSVVTTRCARSQRQTACRQISAASKISAAPGTGSGHGWASRIPPISASTTACAIGRASTTPCRRASK